MKQPAIVGSNQEGEDTANDDCAINCEQSLDRGRRRFADSNHRCNGSECDPLNYRHPHTYLPEADRLDNGGDPTREEVSANQLDQLLVREPDSRRQKQRYYDGTSIKRQYVLEPVNGQPLRGKKLVHRMDGAVRCCYYSWIASHFLFFLLFLLVKRFHSDPSCPELRGYASSL